MRPEEQQSLIPSSNNSLILKMERRLELVKRLIAEIRENEEIRIDARMARQFVDNYLNRIINDIDLSKATEIDDDAAEILVGHDSYRDGNPDYYDVELDLELNKIKRLSEISAKYLSMLCGGLSLNGLTQIDDKVADALGRFRGKQESHMFLNGSTFYGALSLNKIIKINDFQAVSLSKIRTGNLSLDGLSELSDTSARALAELRQIIIPWETSYISPSLPIESHGGNLSLNGIKHLSDSTANALSQFKGNLQLNGITSLSDRAADALSQIDGSLSLNGLTSISDYSFSVLLRIKNKLSLNGLTELDITKINHSSKVSKLCLNGLGSISDSVINSVIDHVTSAIELDGLHELSSFTASVLAKNLNNISLNGIKSLSDDAAIAIFENSLLAPSYYISNLHLNGIDKITKIGASYLYKYSISHLHLNGIHEISDEDAGLLAKFNKIKLSLNGLTKLSETAAKCLVKCNSDICLNGLVELTDASASILSKHKESLELNGLIEVSDLIISLLSKIRGNELHLGGLTSLSINAAKSLAKFKGHVLNLRGLHSLSPDAAKLLAEYHGQISLSGLRNFSEEAYSYLSKGQAYISWW